MQCIFNVFCQRSLGIAKNAKSFHNGPSVFLYAPLPPPTPFLYSKVCFPLCLCPWYAERKHFPLCLCPCSGKIAFILVSKCSSQFHFLKWARWEKEPRARFGIYARAAEVLARALLRPIAFECASRFENYFRIFEVESFYADSFFLNVDFFNDFSNLYFSALNLSTNIFQR